MKRKLSVFLIAAAGLIAMGLFGIFKRKEPDRVIDRLTWFELEIAPSDFRFAIVPQQPIVIGSADDSDELPGAMVIRYEHVPDVYDRVVEHVDQLIKRHGILKLTPIAPVRAFSDQTLEQASIHVRIAYADNTRWASVYDRAAVPGEVQMLIQDLKALAKRTVQLQTKREISGDEAIALLDPAQNPERQSSPVVIVKIKVRLSGAIEADGRQVDLKGLNAILDDLAQQQGVVWYSREAPDQEPTAAVGETIHQVLDAVTQRRLPIQLQPGDG